MNFGLLMHNVARKNVVPSHQLVILKLCGGLQTRRAILMAVARKVTGKVQQCKRSHSHENDDTPPSKRKCAGTLTLVGKHIEMEFTNETESTTWWPGNVTKYNNASDTYEAYFPDDCKLWSLVHLMKTIELFPNS